MFCLKRRQQQHEGIWCCALLVSCYLCVITEAWGILMNIAVLICGDGLLSDNTAFPWLLSPLHLWLYCFYSCHEWQSTFSIWSVLNEWRGHSHSIFCTKRGLNTVGWLHRQGLILIVSSDPDPCLRKPASLKLDFPDHRWVIISLREDNIYFWQDFQKKSSIYYYYLNIYTDRKSVV